MKKSDPMKEISEAIARGEETRRQMILEEKNKEERKKQEAAKAKEKAESGALVKYNSWIKDKLPDQIFQLTSWGNRRIELEDISVSLGLDKAYTAILAAKCKDLGLMVKIEVHHVDECNDEGFRHDAYSYVTHTLEW